MSTPSSASQLDPNLNAILVAEFEYIAKTANSSNEDRARVSNYYLVTTGASVAAIVGAKLDGTSLQGIYWGFSAVFFLLSILGIFTVFMLIRLRAGWMDSAKAMNKIAEYYVRAYPDHKLHDALIWLRNELPPAGKPNSLAFWTAASAILVDSATAAAMVIYAALGFTQQSVDATALMLGVAVGVGFAVFQLWLYFRVLPRR